MPVTGAVPDANVPHTKEPSPCGTTTFVGLRLLDIPLQLGILYYDVGSHLLSRLHGSPIPVSRLVKNPSPARDLPITRLILLAMATGSSLKHIFWVTSLSHETMNTKTAVALGVTNSFFNSVNTLLFTTNITCPEYFSSQDGPTPTLCVGSALFLLGMIIETGSECQRKAFKKDKRNDGKLCREGFWKYVRHANYIGYAVWRTGFAVAAGGWKWGAATAGFTILDFACRASRNLEEHMSQKVSYLVYLSRCFEERILTANSMELSGCTMSRKLLISSFQVFCR